MGKITTALEVVALAFIFTSNAKADSVYVWAEWPRMYEIAPQGKIGQIAQDSFGLMGIEKNGDRLRGVAIETVMQFINVRSGDKFQFAYPTWAMWANPFAQRELSNPIHVLSNGSEESFIFCEVDFSWASDYMFKCRTVSERDFTLLRN